MTKEKIEWIIRRYPYILQSINDGKSVQPIYVGNRRYVILVSSEVRAVVGMIEDYRNSLACGWYHDMIDGILSGKSDVALILQMPFERSYYYVIKRKFVDVIYQLCIAKQMVSYEEILKQGTKL